MLFALFLLLLVSRGLGGGGASLHDASVANEHNSFGACLHKVIRVTQACDNMNVQYTPLLGESSGLGSEYQAYLHKSFLLAILTNRRMVFLKNDKKWEYDCAEKSGWGCYLTFGNCPDSIASAGQIVLSDTIPAIQNPENPISSVLDRQFLELYPTTTSTFNEKFTVLYKALQKLGKVDKEAVCDITQMSFSNISAITTKHLFVYNNETKAAILALNKKNYKTLFSDSNPSRRIGQYPGNYVSLQIRTQDKRYEMTHQQWALMTDVGYIANFTSQHMHDHQHLFVATDNCSMVPVLRKLMSKTITIHSSCDLPENTLYVRGNQDPSMGLALLAEVEMLRHGQEFVGLFESNLVRMIFLLRYPQNTHSHALAAEGSSDPSRQNMNSHLNDINYYNA